MKFEDFETARSVVTSMMQELKQLIPEEPPIPGGESEYDTPAIAPRRGCPAGVRNGEGKPKKPPIGKRGRQRRPLR